MTELPEQTLTPRMVAVDLNYCGEMDYRPQAYPGPGRDTIDLEVEKHRVLIKDGSSVPQDTDLDREGFLLVHHPSQVSDFRDKEEVKQVHFPEVRSLLMSLTGADIVEFPFTTGAYRSSEPGYPSGPAPYPHIDFSEAGTLEVLSRIYPDRPRNIRRWGIYQLWRCLSPLAPVDMPLAVLDGQSVRPEDYVYVDANFDNHIGKLETLFLHYNADHRWTYFSQMVRDDVIVFKAYDSDRDRYFPVAHTSFPDPASPTDGKHYRTSYELRAFVAWS